MRKTILVAVGIAGMVLGNPLSDAQARSGIPVVFGYRPSFVITTRPSFIYLQDQGFSVSYGSPYDIIFYGDIYYLYNNGIWYRSSYYRGPWIVVREHTIPYNLRRHDWNDIRRYRDIEYRRHDRGYWEERNRHDRDRFDGGRHDGRGDGGDQRGGDNRGGGRDQHDGDNRGGGKDQRGGDNHGGSRDQRGGDNRGGSRDQRGGGRDQQSGDNRVGGKDQRGGDNRGGGRDQQSGDNRGGGKDQRGGDNRGGGRDR